MNQGRLHKKNSDQKRSRLWISHCILNWCVSRVMLSTDVSCSLTSLLMQREECHLLSRLLRFLQLLPVLACLCPADHI